MDLNRDAMLVGLHIAAWSGRLYDRQASDHVAVAHEASTAAGRYNKRLLPKAAFAALTATMSEARSKHYSNSLPWDDKGARLLTVANYEHYTELMDGLRERVVRQRARFIEDYDDYIDQARLDLGKLFRIEDYPSKEDLQGKFAIRYRITPVPDADHFIAQLASDDTERVKRDIESHIEEQLHGAVVDLYRRFGEAIERVSERLREDDEGKPLVFRDTMISNIRDLVDVVPRLNIFGDETLAQLCAQVKEKIASVEPDALRPSKTFDPAARAQVKRDADALAEKFAGYFGGTRARARRGAGAGGGLMTARVLGESALRVSDCVTELLHKQPFFGSLVLRLPLRPDPTRETLATDGHEIRYSPRWVADTEAHLIETAMARVVMACALKHHTRRGERDSERWQMASQLVTHALIRDAGFTLPPDAEAWDDLSVEQAYDRLPTPEDGDSGDDGDAPSCADGAGASAAGQSSPDGDDDDAGDPSESGNDADPQDEHGGDERPGRRERGRPERGQPGPGRRCRIRCAAEPRSLRHRRGHGCERPRRGRRRFRRDPDGRRRRGAGLGRGDAPGAQHRPRRGQGAGPGRGNGEGRPCQHARLAHAAAPLHDRRGQERLFLEPTQPALHRLRAVPALDPFGGHRDHRRHRRHLRLAAGRDAGGVLGGAARGRDGDPARERRSAPGRRRGAGRIRVRARRPARGDRRQGPGRHRLPARLRVARRAGDPDRPSASTSRTWSARTTRIRSRRFP